MKHQDFLKRAVELSLQNVTSSQGGPFGCVIVKDGSIIAEASNQVTTLNDPTAHAEIMAIRNACKALNTFSLDGCTIYTSCEPCPMCLSAAYWARVSAVYFCNSKETAKQYGFDDELIYKEISHPCDKRRIKMSYIPIHNECEAFKAWESSPLKIPY